MAMERSRRSNAGNRMSKLIEEAEDEVEKDDFYKTTYGGFDEEECDEDYQSEEGEEDSFDSDFSASEEDDDVESAEDDDRKLKKKVKIFKATTVPSTSTKPKVTKLTIRKVSQPVCTVNKQERMRATTILKGAQVAKTQHLPIRCHPKQPQMRRLTQKELLAEARITEETNLASLAQFMQCEEDKRNAKITKVRYHGPIVRFQSVRMPLVGENGKVDSNGGYCSRSFLEFTDTKSFPREYFPTSKVRYPKKPVCAVTGLPAKYKDPLTGLPYATIEAFKYIRQHRKRLKEQLIARNELKKIKKKKDVPVNQ